MYKLLGICLALASLFAVNFVASAIIALAWRAIRPATSRWSARIRAEVLFTLRISAPLISLVVVGLLIVPAYIGYEPPGTSEIVSRKLAALAALSFLGFTFAIWRAARS